MNQIPPCLNWPEAWAKRLPPGRGKLSAVRLTDEGGGRRRKASQGFKTAPSSVWPAASHRPPCGGKAWGPFKWGGIWSFVGRLDTYIGNWGGVRLLEGGRPSVPPLRRKRGKPGRRAESSRPAEWSAGDGRVRTPTPTGIVGEKRWAHNVRPYTAFTNGSIYKKRDRSGTCPLKRRGEAELRRKFFCLLFFQEK